MVDKETVINLRNAYKTAVYLQGYLEDDCHYIRKQIKMLVELLEKVIDKECYVEIQLYKGKEKYDVPS